MSRRILVLDDEPLLLNLYKNILTDEGYEVITDTKQDLEQVAQLKPDLIILDYLFNAEPMGLYFLRALKSDPTTAHLPVIISTAAGDELYEAKEYMRAEEVNVLFKPFAIDTLLALVEKSLAPV